MPLTNAQKQAAHRARQSAKLARYEDALKIIAQGWAKNPADAAQRALDPVA